MLYATSKPVVLAALAALAIFWPAASRCAAAVGELRLYALDCGHASFRDMAGFSDTGEYDGRPGEIAVPCFLIRHPKGDLLWDAGLGDRFAAVKEGAEPAPGYKLLSETIKAGCRIAIKLSERI